MNSTHLHANLKALRAYADDTDVIFGVQAHDRRALEKLYLTYYGPLAQFLARVGAQAGTLDEIIHDTFMTIWNCAEEFCSESRAAAWIVGIAYRAARQSIGPNNIRGSLPSAQIPRNRDADLASENPYIDRLELRQNRLCLEERATLALTYQMRFSIEEIAEITQVPSATVRMRMIQACRCLRDKT
jgi:RNA polymerase sigma factor (sigma-70 family)